MRDIVIIGAGGFGREVSWLIEDINKLENKWNILGYIDESRNVGEEVGKYKVVGKLDYLFDKDIDAVIAIGNPAAKKHIYEILKEYEIKWPNLIHPNVKYSDSINLGIGNIICAGNILTVDINIHDFVIINLSSTIGHDCIIESYATILPGVNVSGNCTIKNSANIGTGASIIQGKIIGTNSIIGAGAVVVKDIPENCTAVGSPAKPIKYHEN